jgi:parvulin-like peptidyl-prolyl isomerase
MCFAIRPRQIVWFAWGCFGLLAGDVIDRIAITVANQVITESQVDEEVRVTAFLNREKLDLSSAAKKAAAGRLIDQALIKREMELSRYPLPSSGDADRELKDVESRYGSPAALEKALRDYGVKEAELKEHLLWQVTVLRFIDYRFRPGIQIPDADIESYYQQQLLKWRQQGVQPIPSLDDERSQIEEILTQQQVDESLDHWLADARKQAAIRYLDESLK